MFGSPLMTMSFLVMDSKSDNRAPSPNFKARATSGLRRKVIVSPSIWCAILRASARILLQMVLTDLTQPAPLQYGQGWQRVRSRDCFTRLRVRATKPNSLKERILVGARSEC